MTHDDESLVHAIAEVFNAGLTVCDALSHVARKQEFTATLQFEGQAWVVEVRQTPKQIVKITLIE